MDIVGRESYQCDLLFRIIDMKEVNGQKIAILYGEDFRLIADAPYEDLVLINQPMQRKISQGSVNGGTISPIISTRCESFAKKAGVSSNRSL